MGVGSDDELDDETPLDEPSDTSFRTRRHGGVRSPVSESVVFHQGDRRVGGWALNMSRGGLRAAVEEPLAVDEEFELVIGDTDNRRRGRIVWVRKQKDGAIVGVAFMDEPGSVPPPDPSTIGG